VPGTAGGTTVDMAKLEGLHLVDNYAEAAALLRQLGVINKTEARSIMRSARDQGLAITTAEMDALLE